MNAIPDHIPKFTPVERTRIVSMNTDSINLQIAPGEEEWAESMIRQWEADFGLEMERTDILWQLSLNINNYIALVQNDDGSLEIKGKGSLNPDPGIHADHNALVINKAIAHWMLTGGCPEQFIRDAAARREILLFTEMRSAPGSLLRWNGNPVGRLCRVYRSNDPEVGTLTKDATGNASAQTLERGFAYLAGVDWPEADDLDVEHYIARLRLILERTGVEYRPEFNIVARDLSRLGLTVFGYGGSASDLVDGEVVPRFVRPSKTRRRGFSGDRALAVSVTKSSGVIMVEPGVLGESSRIVSYGNESAALGEIHDRARMESAGMTVSQLKKDGVAFVDKGNVIIHQPDEGFQVLALGQAVTGFVDTRPKRIGEAGYVSPVATDDFVEDDGAWPGEGLIGEEAGADEPEVVFDVTNDQFLELMFGDAVGDAFVCSNTVAPDDPNERATRGMWTGGPIEHARGLYQDPSRQNYTCVATFTRDDAGVYRRRAENFQGLHFVVFDDISLDGVGGKVLVDPRALGFGEPTAVIETSPGNSQWFYRLSEPVRDAGQASYLMSKVIATPVEGHLLTDQGAKGITRICKLPQGRNLKHAVAEKHGGPFRNRLLAWRPELAYSPAEICSWFGVPFDEAVGAGRVKAAAAAEDAAGSDLIAALEDCGLLQSSTAKSSGWWDITCPWVDEHTGAQDDGTAVKVQEDGGWTFKCLHGHCADRNAHDLRQHLRAEGYEISPPTGAVLRVDPERIAFGREEELFIWVDDETGEIHEVDREVALDMGFTLRRRDGVEGESRAGAENKGCPTIVLKVGEVARIIDQCVGVLSDVLYSRSGSYYHLISEKVFLDWANTEQTCEGKTAILKADPNWAYLELTKRAHFVKWNEKAKKYCDANPDANYGKLLLNGVKGDSRIRQLESVAAVPFLRADGTICSAPGYDEKTGVFYAPRLRYPAIAENPTKRDAKAAAAVILKLVKDMPFDDPEVHRAVFLCHVLTVVARPAMRTSPFFLYTAADAGSGKTLIMQLPYIIGHGRAAATVWPGDEVELRKRLTSHLEVGDYAVAFDNFVTGSVIKSPTLSAFLTAPDWADRLLGGNDQRTYRNHAVVAGSGNNVRAGSDNSRRTVICRLVTNRESGEGREIPYEIPDLKGYVYQHRAELVCAALTILRAYWIAPDKVDAEPMDSFEDWSRIVRDAVIWLGEGDACASQDFTEEDGGDAIAKLWFTLGEYINRVAAVDQATGKRMFTAAHIFEAAQRDRGVRIALEDADLEIDKKVIGMTLSKFRDKVAGGYKLVSPFGKETVAEKQAREKKSDRRNSRRKVRNKNYWVFEKMRPADSEV